LITVAFAAIFLREHVRIYRWTAVIVGFGGIIVMLWPHLDYRHFTGANAVGAAGAIFIFCAAFANAGAVIQTRRLTQTETTSAIVFYFSLICAFAGLATWPFGWRDPSGIELAALIGSGLCGGLAHILLTESYRFAPASVIAPFDYSAILWAFLLGFVLFGELPTISVYIGSVIVAGAGLYVIWRERKLGLQRKREIEGPRAAV
jgi:drug/metabolite transporter (DMT)-like permease